MICVTVRPPGEARTLTGSRTRRCMQHRSCRPLLTPWTHTPDCLDVHVETAMPCRVAAGPDPLDRPLTLLAASESAGVPCLVLHATAFGRANRPGSLLHAGPPPRLARAPTDRTGSALQPAARRV